MNKLLPVFLFTFFFLLVDLYFFQAIINVSKGWSSGWKSFVRYGFWVPTVISVAVLLLWMFGDPYRYSAATRNWIITCLMATYFSKVVGLLFLFVDDFQRGLRWLVGLFYKESSDLPGESITRSEFLSKAALVATAVPFGTMAFGILTGAHDYRVKRLTIKLPNLPKSFDGIKIGQISDIHSGSFWNKTAVQGGVEMMLKEKPDVIFFTGDLVNNETSEVREYIPVFEKLKAPMGVYSVTGNHDYGDYRQWDTKEAKAKNFQDLIHSHKLLGFDLLMNEHRFLQQGNDRIAIIGNENWGGGRFPKYGKLDQAYAGTEEAPVKLLLSHDPSHWDLQVRPTYSDIDLMLAGHTHGFQFGVEIGNLKWSPSQYVYKQWAGLYQQGDQYLYVNRGFGYLGYPGRIGMPPELTVIELKRG